MSESEECSRLGSVKDCPVCGGKLEKGYFTAPRGVTWDTRKHKLSAITVDSIMPRITSLIALKNVPALRCVQCEIAILDYSEIGGTPKGFLKKCVECGKEIPIASEECYYCRAKQSK